MKPVGPLEVDAGVGLVPEEQKSFCRLCTAACGIVVSTNDDGSLRIRGDASHPISRGYTCTNGRALGQMHTDPHRLDAPQVRRHGTLVEVDWDEWLDDVASRLADIRDRHGPSAIGGFYSGGSYFDATGHRVGQRFLAQLGTRSVYSSYTIDAPNKPLVAEMVGGTVALSPLPDLDAVKCMLVVATNPVVSHGHGYSMPDPVAHLRAVARRGALWVLDPRTTETAQLASHHLATYPGSDYAVLGFLIRALLQDGCDREYLDRYVTDVAQLTAAVEGYSSDAASTIAGVARADLEALLDDVRQAGRVAIVTGTGASMSRSANVVEWLAWSLSIVTGSLDRPGGMWFNPGFFRRNDRCAITPAPSDGNVLPGPASRPELSGRNGQLPAIAIPDEVESGNLRALFALGANVLAAVPGTRRIREALEGLEVFVTADVVANETVALATHVAPCASQLERADLNTSTEILQSRLFGEYTPPVVPLEHHRRPMWWIMAQIAERLDLEVLPGGLSPESATTDDVIRAMASTSPGASPIDDLDHRVLEVGHPVFGWVIDGGVLPGGRWRTAPELLTRQLHELENRDSLDSLILIPRRERHQMNGFLRFLQTGDVPEVWISDVDAGWLDITPGSLVTITSDHGEMTATAHVSSRIGRGTISAPHGWCAPSVNDLLSGEHDVDPLTGMPLMSGVPVRVRRRSASAERGRVQPRQRIGRSSRPR